IVTGGCACLFRIETLPAFDPLPGVLPPRNAAQNTPGADKIGERLQYTSATIQRGSGKERSQTAYALLDFLFIIPVIREKEKRGAP
ncbi:MAG: hypothetical protein LIO46_03265, partial [Clostridiales bacterium]|nr:hypothetical protein [Clostridiales bacterium]